MTKQGKAKGSKKSAEPPLPYPQGRWSRLAFTVAPVIVYLLARQVTLPGVDRDAIERMGFSPGAVSILALGIMPLITAAFLVEVVAAIVPRWRHLRHGGTSGREKLERVTTILTVVFAAYQAHGIASLLQYPAEIVSIGIAPMMLLIGTLVAGVMLLKLLADLISARGLASGYGVFISVGAVSEIVSALYNGRHSLTWMDGAGVLAKIVAVATLTWFMMERLRPALGESAIQKREDNANDGADDLNPYAAPKENASSEEAPVSKEEPHVIHLPVPASGIVPYVMTWSLLGAPMIIVESIPGMSWLMSLVHQGGITFAVVSISVLFSLTWVVVGVFNQPRRVAQVYARISGATSSKTNLEAHAREALRHAIAYALLFMGGLMVIEFATAKLTAVTCSTAGVAIAAALSMDLMREFRAMGSRQDLVPVWPEHRPYAIAAAQKALHDAGIVAHVRDERQRRLLQFGAPYIPMEIFVPQKDARRAAKILNDVLLAKPVNAAESAAESDRQPTAAPRQKPIGTAVIAAIALLAVGVVGLSIPTKKEAPVREARTTKLEFVLIDDEHSIVDGTSRFNNQLPSGIRLEKEQVSIPPGRPVVNEFARSIKAEGETLEAARTRLEAWAKSITVPVGDRVAIGESHEFDNELGKMVVVGWRTYLLTGSAILTEADVASAQAMPDPSSGNRTGWLVRLEFNADGAERFEKVTGENIKRRFAILLDGLVQSAPVIQTKIPGGIATITMGSANTEQQKADARNLEKALNGY